MYLRSPLLPRLKPSQYTFNSDSGLISGEGDDWLIGGTGKDSLVGGSGSDTFVLDSLGGLKIIADFNGREDRIQLIGGLRFEQLQIQGGQGTFFIDNVLTGEPLAVINVVNTKELTANNFIIA